MVRIALGKSSQHTWHEAGARGAIHLEELEPYRVDGRRHNHGGSLTAGLAFDTLSIK